MIIVTGPTGSGKTTTLAASLAEINEPSRKILTIEDPVEYQIAGVNQTQIHPAIGLTFAAALRSFLRQDPDVIMVGEMRDSETAHIGVHAALTGHLVLTTLHTNTAAGAVTRLIDMEVESFLLASCIRALVGQRLVRVLCDNCKEPHCLSAADVARDPRYAALSLAVGDTIYHPKGCDWCGLSGFRGRKGVFEVMEVTPAIRRAIGPKTDATALEQVARSEGMITMTQDGVAECWSGMTSGRRNLSRRRQPLVQFNERGFGQMGQVGSLAPSDLILRRPRPSRGRLEGWPHGHGFAAILRDASPRDAPRDEGNDRSVVPASLFENSLRHTHAAIQLPRRDAGG